MVQHLASAPEHITFVQSTSVQNVAANRNATLGGEGADNSFRAFGKDGFTFWDLIDIVNPLQHIPIVSSLYRSITGDQIDPGSRVIGGALFGGPIGAGVQVVNAIVEHQTGRDFGEHAIALFTGDDSDQPQPRSGPVDVAALQNQFINPALSGFAGPTPEPELIAQPFTGSGPGVKGSAGMSAIPIARGNFAFEDRAVPFATGGKPDLEMLGAVRHSRTSNKPIQLTPRYSVNEETPRPARRTASGQKITDMERTMIDAKNSWVIESMMRGLDKYQTGKRLSADVSLNQVSVLR